MQKRGKQMPYKEKFSEICDLKDSIGKFATDYSSASKHLLNRISAYVNLSAFSGNAAASSKNYFSEFHVNGCSLKIINLKQFGT